MSATAETTAAWEEDPQGVRGPAPGAEHVAVSPDDAWVAVAWGETLRVLSLDDGRIALTVRGRAITGLVWLSPEQLLVLRTGERFGVRAVVHAVPDGGVLASVPLPEMNARTSALSTPAPSSDGSVSAVLIGPSRWHGGDRTKLRRRLSYVLAGPAWEVASTLDPDTVGALPALPLARPGCATLSPDGHELVVWLGDPAPTLPSPGTPPTPRPRGHLLGLDRHTGRVTWRCRAGRQVDGLVGCDPVRWLLRGDVSPGPGEVSLVDTARGLVLYDSADDPAAVDLGWPRTGVTTDLHPDRSHVLVAGWREAPAVAPTHLLAALDLDTGTRLGALRPVSERPLSGAVAAWLGDDRALAVVTKRPRAPTTLTRWDSLTAGPRATGIALEMPKGFDHPVTLSRSPAGRFLLVVTRHRGPATARDDTVARLCLRAVPAHLLAP